jgi:hypothetical protein
LIFQQVQHPLNHLAESTFHPNRASGETTAPKHNSALSIGYTGRSLMVDAEETKLKAEIDQIVKTINETIRKIERVAPFKKEADDRPAADESAEAPTQPLDKP